MFRYHSSMATGGKATIASAAKRRLSASQKRQPSSSTVHATM